MNIQNYLKAISLLDRVETEQPYKAILLQMDLVASMNNMPLVTFTVEDAIEKAR